jgi:putative peptide zinc metalloprotease protein
MQPRPTFSENWHRVAALKPRLRAAVRSFRQQFRGRTWHVLTDPANNNFFRLDESGYHLVALLDGRRTVAQVWHICNEQLGDAAPTQGEVIQILGQLYTSNLLQADLPPDAQGMFDLHTKRRQREISAFAMNFLFMKLPLVDPNRFLQRWVRVAGGLFTPVGFVLWLIVLAVGGYHLAGRWDDLAAMAQPQALLHWENLLWLYVAFAVIKAIHELGHGFACAHFGRLSGAGGQVHTIGIMLMLFMPVPYVDASSSWVFRSKWHRAMVGAAGMYVELAVAALAAVVWARSDPSGLTNALAYNIMFIASVSTLLFNANPLLRFDGYYILSDILELPNLAERGKRYMHYLVRRYLLGVRATPTMVHGPVERLWLLVYAVASSIYRVFISISILLYISGQFFIIGIVMALTVLTGWLIVPIYKFIGYLATSGELDRCRRRAITVSLGFAAAVITLVGIIPMPDRDRAQGVVEPVRLATLHTAADGFIETVADSGQSVRAEEPIITAGNRELEAERLQVQAKIRAATVRRDVAGRDKPAEALALSEQIAALTQRLSHIERQLAGLSVKAPFDGVWFSPQAREMRGVFVKQGEPVGYVADASRVIVRAVADQTLGPRIGAEVGHGEVELRVLGRPEVSVTGRIVKVLEAGHQELPSAALGYSVGGTMAVKADDPQGMQAAEPIFEVHIEPADGAMEQQMLRPGQRVVVRFTMPPRPLAVQWWRMLRQVMQERFAVPQTAA